MHHRLHWFIHMQAHGLKGRWAPRLHSSWGTAYFTFFAKQCGLGRALQWGNYDRAVPLSPGAFLLGGVCCTTFVPPYSTWSLLCISTFKTVSSSTDSTASYRHISTYRTHTNQYYVYKLYMGHRRVTVLDMLPKFLLICHQAAECSCAIPHEQCRQGAHLPFLGLKPTGGQTTEICDAWPVLWLPSQPPDRYQIILLGDRRDNFPRLLPNSARLRVEPTTFGVASPMP